MHASGNERSGETSGVFYIAAEARIAVPGGCGCAGRQSAGFETRCSQVTACWQVHCQTQHQYLQKHSKYNCDQQVSLHPPSHRSGRLPGCYARLGGSRLIAGQTDLRDLSMVLSGCSPAPGPRWVETAGSACVCVSVRVSGLCCPQYLPCSAAPSHYYCEKSLCCC